MFVAGGDGTDAASREYDLVSRSREPSREPVRPIDLIRPIEKEMD